MHLFLRISDIILWCHSFYTITSYAVPNIADIVDDLPLCLGSNAFMFIGFHLQTVTTIIFYVIECLLYHVIKKQHFKLIQIRLLNVRKTIL